MIENERDRRLAEALRDYLLGVVLEALEEAGSSGLCGEGQRELAVDRLRNADLDGWLRRFRKG